MLELGGARYPDCCSQEDMLPSKLGLERQQQQLQHQHQEAEPSGHLAVFPATRSTNDDDDSRYVRVLNALVVPKPCAARWLMLLHTAATACCVRFGSLLWLAVSGSLVYGLCM